MKTLSSHPLLAAVTLCLLTASAASCSKAAPTPEKASPEAPSSASFAPSASAAVAQAAPPKSALPTLVPEVFEPAKGLSLHPIEGALIVVSGMRVGRIVDERIEWFATLPETNAWLGGSQINDVTGSWPDDVNVVYSSNNDRASQPSIYPLTSKGTSVTFAPGGGQGWIAGTARLGKTTVVGGNDMLQGSRIVTMRGPGLVFKPIPRDKGGCKEGELDQPWRGGVSIAVPFSALGATAQGTLVTIGNLCDRPNAPVAEVWDQPGKSRIIDLGPLVKSLGYYPHILNGKGDDLWLATSPVIHYNGGKFEALPSLDRPWKNLFVSPAGKLHGIHGRTIYRHDDEKWTPVANLAWPTWFSSIAMDEHGTLWVKGNTGVARLREREA